jgi:hypothetical protein
MSAASEPAADRVIPVLADTKSIADRPYVAVVASLRFVVAETYRGPGFVQEIWFVRLKDDVADTATGPRFSVVPSTETEKLDDAETFKSRLAISVARAVSVKPVEADTYFGPRANAALVCARLTAVDADTKIDVLAPSPVP